MPNKKNPATLAPSTLSNCTTAAGATASAAPMHASNELAPPRVLIVEDESDLREILSDLVEELGCEVLVASDGESGLAIAQSLNPDLVLVDYRMPGMTGAEMARCARCAGVTVPIVLMSAADKLTEIASGAGLSACLAKPFSVARLKSTLREHGIAIVE